MSTKKLRGFASSKNRTSHDFLPKPSRFRNTPPTGNSRVLLLMRRGGSASHAWTPNIIVWRYITIQHPCARGQAGVEISRMVRMPSCVDDPIVARKRTQSTSWNHGFLCTACQIRSGIRIKNEHWPTAFSFQQTQKRMCI